MDYSFFSRKHCKLCTLCDFFLKIGRFSINAYWLEYIQNRTEKINLAFN